MEVFVALGFVAFFWFGVAWLVTKRWPSKGVWGSPNIWRDYALLSIAGTIMFAIFLPASWGLEIVLTLIEVAVAISIYKICRIRQRRRKAEQPNPMSSGQAPRSGCRRVSGKDEE